MQKELGIVFVERNTEFVFPVNQRTDSSIADSFVGVAPGDSDVEKQLIKAPVLETAEDIFYSLLCTIQISEAK